MLVASYFLRLARWFAAADDEQAHRLDDAAFGAFGEDGQRVFDPDRVVRVHGLRHLR